MFIESNHCSHSNTVEENYKFCCYPSPWTAQWRADSSSFFSKQSKNKAEMTLKEILPKALKLPCPSCWLAWFQRTEREPLPNKTGYTDSEILSAPTWHTFHRRPSLRWTKNMRKEHLSVIQMLRMCVKHWTDIRAEALGLPLSRKSVAMVSQKLLVHSEAVPILIGFWGP